MGACRGPNALKNLRLEGETPTVTSDWLLLGLCVLLTLATGGFVAAEFSLITLDRASIEKEAAAGNRGARGILSGLKTLSTQLSGAQVGITLTTLLVGYFINDSLTALLRPAFAYFWVPETALGSVSTGFAIALATAFSMIVGELIPKNLAISAPRGTASWSVPFQRGFTWVMSPLIAFLNGSANVALRWLGLEPQEELSAGRSPEELVSLVQRSAREGTLDENIAERLTKSLGFDQLVASDVMTPRGRMTSLQRTSMAAEVTALSRSTGLSRFPVIDTDSDDVVGIVHVKSVVGIEHKNRSTTPVTSIMREARRVPETMGLTALLAELKSGGSHVALVLDEYGGTAGLVTLEDVIEELVGDVSDEHDKSEGGIRRLASGGYMVSGMTRPDELAGAIGVDIEESPAYETVAGYMQHTLERLGKVGDSVATPGGVLTIVRMDEMRIDRVKYVPASAKTTEVSRG